MGRLAFHQLKGALGVGDMHPGGVGATELLLGWMETRAHDGFRVLEVGAGIGNTSRRMAGLGWSVTALERDPVLYRRLSRNTGIRALNQDLAEHEAEKPYDAVIAESVLYMNDLESVSGRIREVLKPGGLLAFVEAVWTEVVPPDEAAEIHDRSNWLFGIPVASRVRLTWDDWRRVLQATGFERIEARRLEPVSPGRAWSMPFGPSLSAILRHPTVVPQALAYRYRMRQFQMPEGSLEGWAYLGRTTV